VQNQFNLYVKLMEECGETVQAASKALKRGRHGVEKYNLSEECSKLLLWISS
jgi:NTP pyrophosphatase (non-canonical NTP hydrolase)